MTPVEKLMKVIGGDNMYDEQVSVLFDNFAQSGFMSLQMAETMKTAFMEVFTLGSFMAIFEKHLTARFSDAELETIAKFYSHGVGKKWAAEHGAMMGGINGDIRDLTQARMPQVMEIFERLMNSQL